MSSGWVPPVASAVKEYGQVTGCVAPSYMQLVTLPVTLQVASNWVLVVLHGHIAGLPYLGC